MLLFLQFLREATGGIFDSFFLMCSTLTDVKTVLIFFAIVYWCIDKKLGEYLLVCLNFTRVINGFLKITICQYRPWILDSRVHPVKEAMDEASSYSYPSGHSAVATTLFGGSILKANLRKGLKIILVICIILVCLSRCYLGVHSPLDVICSVGIALITLFILKKVFDKYGDNPNLDLIIASVGIAISLLLIIYASTKSYPIDYDAAGKILVEPAEMALDTFKNAGLSIGILLSWVIERRFIKFSSEGSVESKVMRLIGGFIGYEIVLTVVYPIVKDVFIPELGKFLCYFIFPVYIMILVPIIIKLFQNREKVSEEDVSSE